MKRPKLYWGDVGLALHLNRSPEPAGAYLENLVLLDLLVRRDGRQERAEVLHWRTAAGEEVDSVVETPHGLLPVEVQASPRLRPPHAEGLRASRREYGRRCRAGLLLPGEELTWLVEHVLAAPWWMVC